MRNGNNALIAITNTKVCPHRPALVLTLPFGFVELDADAVGLLLAVGVEVGIELEELVDVCPVQSPARGEEVSLTHDKKAFGS